MDLRASRGGTVIRYDTTETTCYGLFYRSVTIWQVWGVTVWWRTGPWVRSYAANKSWLGVGERLY